MARFFIATLNYAPEPTGFAPRVTLIAEYLAERGHIVDVFTGFPFTPRWSRRPEDRGKLAATERKGTLTVHRVTHFIPRRPSSAVQRILMEGTFSLATLVVMAGALTRGRPDAILYVGAQPAIAMLARFVSWVVRRPYFVNVTDLAAQLGRDVGIVGDRLYPLLERFEFAAYSAAAGASVLSQSFADALIRYGYPAARIRVARDPIDLDLIRPVTADGTFRARYGIPSDAFVVLHAGSIGRKTGLMNIIEAAKLIRGTGVCWILVGDGEGREELLEAVERESLHDDIRFVPFQPDEEMSAMFADANALLLNQLRTVKDTVIPSKLLTYMAAGRPVIAAVNARSQAAEIIRDADGGLLVAPEDAPALAAAASQLAQAAADHRANYGRRNRAYAEEHFDRHQIVTAQERFMLDRMNASHQRGAAA